jgi:hypothetical protein
MEGVMEADGIGDDIPDSSGDGMVLRAMEGVMEAEWRGVTRLGSP